MGKNNQKRVLDLCVALPLLIFTFPVQIVIFVLVRLSSPGPAIYRADRIGRDGIIFTMYKFRTMFVGVGGIAVTSMGDRRVTKIGRWLRKTKLDELPQLLNVVRGDMSLVGRRPEDPAYVALYSEEQLRVLLVPPALTGPSMVINEEVLITGITSEEVHQQYVNEIMPAKIAIDLHYLDSWTVFGDIRILALTIKGLLSRTGSGARNRSVGASS